MIKAHRIAHDLNFCKEIIVYVKKAFAYVYRPSYEIWKGYMDAIWCSLSAGLSEVPAHVCLEIPSLMSAHVTEFTTVLIFLLISVVRIFTLARSSRLFLSTPAKCSCMTDTWASLCQGTLKMLLYFGAWLISFICSIVPTNGHNIPTLGQAPNTGERLGSKQCNRIQVDCGTFHLSVLLHSVYISLLICLPNPDTAPSHWFNVLLLSLWRVCCPCHDNANQTSICHSTVWTVICCNIQSFCPFLN